MRRSEFLKQGAAFGAAAVALGAPKALAGTSKGFLTWEPTKRGAASMPIGFRTALVGREDHYPLLARSLAYHPHDIGNLFVDCAGKKNWTQIFRVPFTMTNSWLAANHYGKTEQTKVAAIREESLIWMLEHVETALLAGRAHKTPVPKQGASAKEWENYAPRQTMGGAFQFLGRAPRKRDTFDLCTLRDLIYLENRQANDSDSRTDEWLCEITVHAVKA